MLKKIRIAMAAICFVLITLIFLDFTGLLHSWFGWLAKIQFFPAILASNFIIIGLLVLITLLFGRVYCSILCPLGIIQDAVSFVAKTKAKKHFSYHSSRNPLRYIVLAIFIIAVLAGFSPLMALLEPYSAFGRIASNLFVPIYKWGNNFLAYIAERMNSYAFYSVDVWMKSVSTFIISIITLVILVILSWKNGRLYCNTICPIGTVLGLLSKFSLLKPRINEEKCTHCGLCAKKCKASCIDAKAGTIDYSRCITCFNCIGSCPQDGLQYTLPRLSKKSSQIDKEIGDEKISSRRRNMVIYTLFGITIAKKLFANGFDGGLAIIKAKKEPKRTTDIAPPGSLSIQNLKKHCTACQLCISACPNQVLRPSSNLESFMQPEMSYDRGYCRPECVRCSDVCPTGAILKINVAEKSSIQIGHAVWKKELCIVNRDNVQCDNCARHCPTGAITMIPRKPNERLKIPMVNESRCIGCGACENLCPSRPYSAIYVEGHESHKTI